MKMHPNTRLKFVSASLKSFGVALASALLLLDANAAGLGKLIVLSGLGQPLRAEIELTSASKEDAATLMPKLASVEAFKQASIEFNPVLLSLRFAIEQRGGKQFIRVTSAEPINEPFVDMLVELGGAGNHLLREYTFLLDPIDLHTSQSPQVAPSILLPPAPLARRTPGTTTAPERGVASSAGGMPSAAGKPEHTPSPAAERSEAATSAPGVSEYRVKKGDSLSKIAARVKPAAVSLDQMLVALYRANPDGFLGKNMNRLRAGQILTVPDAGQAEAASQGEARQIVIAQAADFETYRNKLGSRVATAMPQKSAEATQTAAGKITAKVEEHPTAANQAQDKLKLSKSGVPNAADMPAKLAADAEEKIARDKALAEANARVKELEKNVTDLKKLLEVEDKNLAEQQKQADAAKSALKAAVASAAGTVSAQNAIVPEPKIREPKVDESKPVPPPAAVNVRPPPAASKPVSESPAKPEVKPVAPPTQASWWDDLLDSAFLWPGVGLLIAAFGALGIYRIRARRAEPKKNFGDSIITDSSLKANSLFGSTGGQSVDTNNSVFNSNFTPSSHQLDSNEVDPVAEADVYIAYGRDAQAEEILKEALRNQPGRNAVRIKLLEIYSNRKDLRAFETLATELYGITKGEGDDWIQAANLGIALDPKNPLYAAGKPPEAAGLQSAALAATTLPLEEPDLDALLAVTQADESLESLNTIEDSAYFSNTAERSDGKAAVQVPEKAEPNLELSDVKPAAERGPLTNMLDFDLQGMGLESVEVPNTIARHERQEPKEELDAIHFDFLDKDKDKAEPVEVKPAPVAEALVLEHANAKPEAALEVAEPPIAAAVAAAPSPIDFDLSGITLELNAEEATAETLPSLEPVPDSDSHEYTNTAEMATKLDLAVAYQEIGDKEGARELLEEVVKGGTPEQMERAKSVLQKLG